MEKIIFYFGIQKKDNSFKKEIIQEIELGDIKQGLKLLKILKKILNYLIIGDIYG